MKEWADARAIIGSTRVTLGEQASQQWLHQPDHLAMVLARYRAAAALIGDSETVLEVGAGECIGGGILARGRRRYTAIDPDMDFEAVQSAFGSPQGVLVEVVKGTLCSEGICTGVLFPAYFQAAVALDVIEHLPPDDSEHFIFEISRHLDPHGIAVIGTPSAYAAQWASPQSQVAHINNLKPDQLKEQMQKHFHRVMMMYSQDTSIHFGRPEMAHYMFGIGISPRVIGNVVRTH